jgi:hypothetical protein
MPFYNWVDLNSKLEVEVLRPVSQFDFPPIPDDEYDPAVIPDPVWERTMPSGTSWKQAPGYRAGGKGAKGGFNPKTSRNREITG